MGKLFFSRLTVLIGLLFVTGLRSQQEAGNYCVFQVVGKPMLIDAEPGGTPLEKGMFVYPQHSLTLNEGDKLILTDEEGVLYEIGKRVTMPHGRIKRYAKREIQSAFTLEYLKYIWTKLWEREEKENIGVVFRSERYKLPITPLDSVQIFMKDVPFVWNHSNKDEVVHFYLQEEGAQEFVKMAATGDRLILPIDGQLLNFGRAYRWAVIPDSDNKMENLMFRSFELLEKPVFEEKLKELNGIRREFMALGLSDEEIRRTFCEDLKLCFN